MSAILVLEDGSVYEGKEVGASGTAYGEVVFNTSMTGYQEMLTDPSYAGQILVFTYPLIGNYGINPEDVESKKVQVAGVIAKEICQKPSHYNSVKTLDQYLKENNIPAITGIDTRALTKKLRGFGVMMGLLSTELTPEQAKDKLRNLPQYGELDFVSQVSCLSPYEWGNREAKYHFVALDCGLKLNILRLLAKIGCRISVFPAKTLLENILSLKPDGFVFSPGPGDPARLSYLEEVVRGIIRSEKPILAICLGHQILARALGATTFKLKFGHRGANHPVKDLLTNRVYITAQNHGYAVDGNSLKGGLEVSQINLNDFTVEGLRHRYLPIISIQYHPEASPGPQDNSYIFNRFINLCEGSYA